MVIDKIVIQKFRGLENMEIPLGKKITIISGHNGTMKTTLLGIIGTGFTIGKLSPMYGEKAIDGYNFKSQFQEKFKISPKLDVVGEHSWDLYISNKEIYNDNNGIFGIKSIYRNKESGEIRFWNKGGKSAGDGFIQCPVIYLSLKRVIPVGEENKINIGNNNLTEEEQEVFKTWYNKIFTVVGYETYKLKKISSTNKKTVGIENNIQDAFTISAGQDNIGKILISLLSFRRLKEKYSNDYKAGILLIDEIESTMHPSALKNLLSILEKESGELNLQIVLTTHNHDIVIRDILSRPNRNEYKVIYLTKRGRNINLEIDPSMTMIKNELYLQDEEEKSRKIKVYCEDDITLTFLKSILDKNNKSMKNIKYEQVSLGCSSYIELVKKKFEEFTNSIIVFDADQNDNKEVKKYNNIIVLPGNFLPEKEIFEFLYQLPEEDEFWEKNVGGYSKQRCFNLFEKKDLEDKKYYKDWYFKNKSHFGKLNNKIMSRWCKCHQKEVDEFNELFRKEFEELAKKNHIESI